MENQAPQEQETPETSPYKKRRSASHEGEGGEGEPWLVSYADMMTLLFGFFVVMYSLEATKKENLSETAMESARKALAEYFGGTYANPLGEVEKYINSSVGFASKRRSNDIKVQTVPEGMKIVMRSQLLFDLGKAELNEEAKKLITKLAVVIKSTNVAGLVRVEGHTDDSPISTPVFPSNWELSSARATSVVRGTCCLAQESSERGIVPSSPDFRPMIAALSVTFNTSANSHSPTPGGVGISLSFSSQVSLVIFFPSIWR